MVNINSNLGRVNTLRSLAAKTVVNKGDDKKLGKTDIEPYTITARHKDGTVVTVDVGDRIDHDITLIEKKNGTWVEK